MALSHTALMLAFEQNVRNTAFFFDFDGTMVDLVSDPEAVHVPDSLLGDIRAIVEGRRCVFAIVSGRAIARIDAFFKGVKVPVVGNHGAEMRVTPDGSVRRVAYPVAMDIRLALQAVCKRHDAIFDDKVYTLSIHLPFRDADKDITLDIVKALGPSHDEFVIRRAGRTREILQKGLDKGQGIVHLLQQPEFSGMTPLYVGDDVDTDDSLKVIRSMGGTLVPVLHTYDRDAKPTRPDQLLVADVQDCLARMAGRNPAEV